MARCEHLVCGVSGVTLLFSHHSDDWISRSIAWLTYARWTHVAFLCDGGEFVIEASGMGRPKGVRMVPLFEWLDRHPDCDVRFVPHANPKRFEDVLRSQVGKGYDWLWLFGWLFRNPRLGSGDRWVCSELLAWASLVSGDPKFDGDTHRVTPQMWHDISLPGPRHSPHCHP